MRDFICTAAVTLLVAVGLLGALVGVNVTSHVVYTLWVAMVGGGV